MAVTILGQRVQRPAGRGQPRCGPVERFRAVVSVRPESLGAVPKMRPGCALSSQEPPRPSPSDQAQGQACPADRLELELELELKSNQTRRGATVQTLLLSRYAMLSLLFCTLARCALPLLCLAAVLQPTALPSVEITKLDSHLRYCTLTATPPAFHHPAQAATPMPVASLRLLTRLPRQLSCQACSATPPGVQHSLAVCENKFARAGFSPASHVRSAGCIPP